MKSILILSFTLLLSHFLKAQSFSVNTDGSTANTSALLDVKSTAKGILIPRMTTGEKNSITSPAKGLLVFDNTTNSFWYYDATQWVELVNTSNNIWAKNGNNIFKTNTGNVGIGTNTPVAALQVSDSNVVFTGPASVTFPTPYGPSVQGPGTRMLWYAQKAAFRVGFVDGTQWDKDSIGLYSFAAGLNSKASGLRSVAIGSYVTASGFFSTAIGSGSSATGEQSLAMGAGTIASSYWSTAMGVGTIASGIASTAMNSFNSATGSSATAMGIGTIASGLASTAMGSYTKAKSEFSLVIGINNDTSNINSLFEIGNGDSYERRNAMTVLINGNVGIGTPNPNALLQFVNTIANRKLVLFESANNDNQYYGLGINGATLRYQVDDVAANHVFYAGSSAASSNELFRIKGNGDIGIGAPSPFAYGHGGTNRIMELKNSAAAGLNVQSHLILSSTGNTGSLGGVTWASTSLAGEQRTGFIGNIYETANATRLVFYARSGAGALAEKFNIQSNGNALLQGTLTQLSDSRFKTNIRQLDNSLQKIQKLHGYTYNWIDESKDKDVQIGLLAQEVQKIYPELVKQNDDGNLSVNYIGLIPVLLEGMKAQQKQMDEQRKLIDELIKSKK